jgi:hypothetical protein
MGAAGENGVVRGDIRGDNAHTSMRRRRFPGRGHRQRFRAPSSAKDDCRGLDWGRGIELSEKQYHAYRLGKKLSSFLNRASRSSTGHPLSESTRLFERKAAAPKSRNAVVGARGRDRQGKNHETGKTRARAALRNHGLAIFFFRFASVRKRSAFSLMKPAASWWS